MTTRASVVAGSFYPHNKAELLKVLSLYVKPDLDKKDNAVAAICPHAGYIYSGKTAGKVYSLIKIPNTVIILSPNHTGMGEPISIDANESWETPLGITNVDTNIIKKIKTLLPEAKLDLKAQSREHALEVHLPFIQYINAKAKIVPITLAGLSFELIQKTGKILAEIIIEAESVGEERPLIIASSDMTHFESAETARKKDFLALNKISEFDTKGFVSLIEGQNLSICGLYTVATVMEATIAYCTKKALKPKATLIDYTNSGAVTGDTNEVVAYAGMILKSN